MPLPTLDELRPTLDELRWDRTEGIEQKEMNIKGNEVGLRPTLGSGGIKQKEMKSEQNLDKFQLS